MLQTQGNPWYMKDHIFELRRKMYKDVNDHRSYAVNLSICEKKHKKEFRLERDQSCLHVFVCSRRGSRINGDRFPKQRTPKAQASRGVRGHAPPGNALDFNHLSPLSCVSESFWKLWPISVKRWKPVWIRACFQVLTSCVVQIKVLRPL